MNVKLLDRYLFREIASTLKFSVALFTTILVAMQELQPLTSLVVEHHVSLWIAGRIFVYSIPYFMALAFPMAMLLSALLAFGQLSGDSEIVAMQAAGVSFTRMAAPVMVSGLIVSLIAISFNEIVTPVATREKNRLSDMVARAGIPNSGPVHLEHNLAGGGRLLLNARGYDQGTRQVSEPTILFFDASGRPVILEWAPRGIWEGATHWTLEKGEWEQIAPTPDASVRHGNFDKQDVDLGFSLDQLLSANQDRNEMTYRQLHAYIVRERKEHSTPIEIAPDLVTLYSKISIPLASFVFALVGFPLGVRRQRSGKAVGYAMAIGIIFLYYLVYQYSSILGGNGAFSPMVGAWLPDLLGLGIALVLVQRAVA